MTNLYTSPLLQKIFHQAAQNPARTAMQETSGKKISYGELASRIDTIALNLARQGFEKGDKVLLLVRPGIAALVLLLAVVRAGGVIVVADLAMGRKVFESRVKLAAPRWVLAESLLLILQRIKFLRSLARKKGLEIPEIGNLGQSFVINVGPPLPGIPSDLQLSSLLKPVNNPVFNEMPLAPDDDLLIIFTSGTTDLPKGVVHNQRSIEATATIVQDKMNLRPQDVLYSGSLHLIIPALMAGATSVIARGKFNPKKTLAVYRRYRVTKTFGVPAEFEELIRYCKKTGEVIPPELDSIMMGAAPVLRPFLARLVSMLPEQTRVFTIYGMTEILPVSFCSLEEKLAFDAEGDLLGRPVESATLEIAADGELLLSGPHLFERYLGQPAVKQFATGDLAKVNSAGQVILLGRKKDMIIRGNNNIYPGLVESTISQVPGVRECALVGSYNPVRSDEELVLVVEVEQADTPFDEARFRRFLEKELRTGPHSIDLYALPDTILFLTLPRAGRSQKVDKLALKELIRDRYAPAGNAK